MHEEIIMLFNLFQISYTGTLPIIEASICNNAKVFAFYQYNENFVRVPQ